MGLNWDLVKGRSKNDEVFGGISENDEKKLRTRFEVKERDNKGMGKFASVF